MESISEKGLLIIEEAKRRGFKRGVKFTSLEGRVSVFSGDVAYFPDEDQLINKRAGGTIYLDGKWASIAPAKELPQTTSDLYYLLLDFLQRYHNNSEDIGIHCGIIDNFLTKEGYK